MKNLFLYFSFIFLLSLLWPIFSFAEIVKYSITPAGTKILKSVNIRVIFDTPPFANWKLALFCTDGVKAHDILGKNNTGKSANETFSWASDNLINCYALYVVNSGDFYLDVFNPPEEESVSCYNCGQEDYVVIKEIGWPTPIFTVLPPKENKITICHKPRGNPAEKKTIRIDESAISSHLKHGDTLGECK